MNTLKKLPEEGERFIIGRKTSRRVGIVGDSTAVVNGKTIATAGITLAFKPADNLLWDSEKAEDASGRKLTKAEIEVVREWAVSYVPRFPDMFFVPAGEVVELQEQLNAEKAKESSRFVSGTRTTDTIKGKGK